MNKKEYFESFKDPRWQKKRLEILERDNFTCCLCESKASQLHVHHTIYFEDTFPWEYPNRCLKTLCDNCHKEEHEELFDCLKQMSHTLRYLGYLSNEIWDLSDILGSIKMKADTKTVVINFLRSLIN